MEVDIRNLKVSEITKAAQIFCDAFNSVGELWSLETAIKRVEQYYNPNSCWVAVINSEIVGMLTSKIDNVIDHQELYIDIIAVNPDVHQKGIGKKLLQTAESYAKGIGLDYVWGTASPKLYSYKWYLKTGFIETSWKVITKKISKN